MAAPLMLLDGASLWFRAFHGIPEKITAPDGRPVNAVRGFLDMIAVLVERDRPRRLVTCLDVDWRPEFRVALIPSYKAHRVAEVVPAADGETFVEEVPDTLTPQVAMIADVLAAAGIASAGAHDCEADDVIGTLADSETQDPVVVVSGDRDLLQVVRDDPVEVRVLYVGKGVNRAERFGPDEVAAKYAVPQQHPGTAYAELAILRGDPSDGLPGVKGVGEKTASTLLREFGDLDAVEAAARAGDRRISARIAASITDAHDYLAAARTVVFVRTDADVVYESGDAPALVPAGPADGAALSALVDELGIGSSVNRMATAFGWDERF
ncbi:5'-3' exonuclease [Williamsia deligens]|uniref:5'-3' exonuclease n=1 Tax=Williamsia deligens TaxID=321325 RepID=A0ABW3GGB5_9NOCA|nr:5'-3' exonuclease [Williamsia deligens]MCP2195201.1 5'-3' exonuclease [Williamsia deligens]